jgi:hypothetical protein
MSLHLLAMIVMRVRSISIGIRRLNRLILNPLGFCRVGSWNRKRCLILFRLLNLDLERFCRESRKGGRRKEVFKIK